MRDIVTIHTFEDESGCSTVIPTPYEVEEAIFKVKWEQEHFAHNEKEGQPHTELLKHFQRLQQASEKLLPTAKVWEFTASEPGWRRVGEVERVLADKQVHPALLQDRVANELLAESFNLAPETLDDLPIPVLTKLKSILRQKIYQPERFSTAYLCQMAFLASRVLYNQAITDEQSAS